MQRILIALITAGTAASARAQLPWDASRQALVVTTAGWDATAARVQRWERASPAVAWRRVGPAVDATVGRSGLGWGAGQHRLPPLGLDGRGPGVGPSKQEGDGRAPAGVYRLSSAFGYALPAEVGWIRMPYLQARPTSRCVDDTTSRWYNRWVEEDRVTPDWNSREDMRRQDELYRLGVWVEHNGASVPGAGSCIFLHIQRGPGVPTVGCTGFAAPDLEEILRWLDPAALPVLVQLPEETYGVVRQAWRLP